jgi:hypothetical protein
MGYGWTAVVKALAYMQDGRGSGSLMFGSGAFRKQKNLRGASTPRRFFIRAPARVGSAARLFAAPNLLVELVARVPFLEFAQHRLRHHSRIHFFHSAHHRAQVFTCDEDGDTLWM